MVAACKPIERCVRECKSEFEFGYRASEHDKIDGSTCSNGRKQVAKEQPVGRIAVQARENSLANRFIPETRSVGRRHDLAYSVVEDVETRTDRAGCTRKASHLCELSSRKVALRDQQMRNIGVMRRKLRGALRWRENKALRIVEGISGACKKAAIPHQFRIERRVGDGRRAALISRSSAMRAYRVIVLDANCNRLRVAHPIRWRVTTSARIVIVQSPGNIEPEQSP